MNDQRPRLVGNKSIPEQANEIFPSQYLVWNLFPKKHVKYLLWVAVLLFVITLVLLDYRLSDGVGEQIINIVGALILTPLYMVGICVLYYRNQQLRVLGEFARQLGLERVHSGNERFDVFKTHLGPLQSVGKYEVPIGMMLFSKGNLIFPRFVYYGTYRSEQIRIFHAQYPMETGSGKFNYDVFAVELEAAKPLVDVMIVPTNFIKVAGLTKVKTSSNDFDFQFNVFAKGEHPASVFELLQPDDMHFMLDHLKKLYFAIETSGKKVFVVFFALPSNKETFVEFLDFSIHLSKELNKT